MVVVDFFFFLPGNAVGKVAFILTFQGQPGGFDSFVPVYIHFLKPSEAPEVKPFQGCC